MTFDDILAQVITLLQRQGRVSYSALKRRFDLNDDYLNDLKDELLFAYPVVDEDNRGLVWTGESASAAAPPPARETPALAPAPVTDPERAPLAYTPKHLVDKILTSRSALEGERKQVTVLFADIAGFTTLAEQLDPEIVHDIMNRCFEGITAEVHRFEGTVNQYTGDGVMALFGAPLAHEDSPRRAVYAALGIQRAIRDVAQALQAERGLSLEMRMGINTGLVVVGKIGDDLRMDYTAVGDTTNLAARLQQIAQPGSVVISAATHQHVAGFFETRDLGEIPVKGRAPVHAYEVLRPRGRRTRLDVAVERGLTPLVSRERELAMLRERFREVKAGRGQVVGIAGDAGLGKSRLLLEFRRALAQAGEAVTWLEGHCISFGHASPFLPLIELLREHFEIDEFDGEPDIIAKVEQGMRRMGELEAHLPAIRSLLSVAPGDPAFAALEGAARRRHLFAALQAVSLRGVQRRPLVLIIEDLHWIDTSSEEFLTFLLDAVAGVPLLLLVTYRIGYTPPFGSRSFSTTLTLHSFSEAETLVMAGQVLGTAQFPAELQTALLDKAEGVPLFIEEVTKTLLDLGVLQRDNGGYRLVKRLSEVHVPDTIQGIIMARLDRLGDDAKRTVQMASVIGRQFLVRLLARVAGLSERLTGLLRELQALEIIYEQGLVPEPAYIFKHAVIQDVAYHSLLLQRRKALHRAVGEAIEELYQDRLEEHYAELAHHFTQGEVWEKALHSCRQAGAQAVARSAYREAVAYFEQALAALEHLPERHEILAQAIDLRLDLRNALLPLDEQARVFEHLRAAEPLAERLGDPQRLGLTVASLCFSFTVMGEHDRAIAAGQRALALATTSDAFDVQVNAQNNLSVAYYAAGDYRQALDVSQRMIAVLTGKMLSERFGLPIFPGILARGYVAWCLAELGDFAEGAGVGEEAIRLAEAVAQPNSLVVVLYCIGLFYRRHGMLQKAIPLLERGLALAQSVDIPLQFPMTASLLSAAYALAGRTAEALPLLDQMLERLATGRRMYLHALALTELSEACLLVGRVDEASTLAAHLLELSHTHTRPVYRAHACRLLGEVARRREPPDLDQAATHYRQALTLAEEMGMRPLQAYCHQGLGTLFATAGQAEQARAELSTAIAMYQAMEMTFWLSETEAALAQMEGGEIPGEGDRSWGQGNIGR